MSYHGVLLDLSSPGSQVKILPFTFPKRILSLKDKLQLRKKLVSYCRYERWCPVHQYACDIRLLSQKHISSNKEKGEKYFQTSRDEINISWKIKTMCKMKVLSFVNQFRRKNTKPFAMLFWNLRFSSLSFEINVKRKAAKKTCKNNVEKYDDSPTIISCFPNFYFEKGFFLSLTWTSLEHSSVTASFSFSISLCVDFSSSSTNTNYSYYF